MNVNIYSLKTEILRDLDAVYGGTGIYAPFPASSCLCTDAKSLYWRAICELVAESKIHLFVAQCPPGSEPYAALGLNLKPPRK
jgi:hypothetical protein